MMNILLLLLQDDSSTKKGVMFDKLFDQIVELSLGSGKKLVESEVLKATWVFRVFTMHLLVSQNIRRSRLSFSTIHQCCQCWLLEAHTNPGKQQTRSRV